MTRLNAMRALLALPAQDNHRRAFTAIDGCETADRAKLAIKVKRKPRKKSTSSRMAFVRAVHYGKGA